jgi:flotillin
MTVGIANALAQARMVTISGGENGGASNSTAEQISSVIQTVMAAQLVQTSLRNDAPAPTPAPAVVTPAPAAPSVSTAADPLPRQSQVRPPQIKQ